MRLKLLVALLTTLTASAAVADLRPDCDPKKAARNAAMDATVGVSGRCDTDKLAKDAKEDLSDSAKDAVDVDRDKHRKRHRDADRKKKKKD
mgnify:FL=1